MPRRAPYYLHWSSQAQAYKLAARESSIPCDLIPGSRAWFEWLESIRSFAFSSRSGAYCTVRKETIQHSGSYWYGYRSLQGRTVKRYVGRTIAVSLSRLEEVAERLTGESPTPSAEAQQEAPRPLFTRLPILASKLHPPRLPRVLVERPPLFARLDAGHCHKLTLLSAPAGFGKTTLVNHWLATGQARNTFSHMAWISLDASDNDPISFWHSIITACQTWQEEVGKAALAHLLSPLQPPFEPTSLEAMLILLLHDLSHLQNASILVLDDYQVLSEPRLHDAMAFFIDHLPPTLHVLILTRTEPPLPLVRWRAKGDMQELHAADLRFSLAETATFLQQATPSPLSEATIQLLGTRLEGWVTGLRLLVLTLHGQMTQSEVARHFSALDEHQRPDHLRRPLLDYFVSEVLHAQTESLQLFLLQTSVLSRMTGSLCDEVTGRHNSAALLEAVEWAGLFLEPLDGTGQWYRYHALFAEAMRIEASRHLGEDERRALSLRASYWYAHHSMLMEAVEAALFAQDRALAATLMEQLSERPHFQDYHTLRRWVKQVPETVLQAHPALCFSAAIALRSSEEQNETLSVRVEEMLQMAEMGWQRRGDISKLLDVFAFRALLAWWQGKLVQAVDLARKALTWPSSEDWESLLERIETDIPPERLVWDSICLGIIGIDMGQAGRFAAARHMLLQALRGSNAAGNQVFSRVFALMLGVVCFALGELQQSATYYRRVRSKERSPSNEEQDTQALLGLAQLSYEWNDLTTMEQQAYEALELPGEHEQAVLLLALKQHAQGQSFIALQQIALLLSRLQTRLSPDALQFLPEVLAWQIRMQLVVGDLFAAERSLATFERNKQTWSPLQQEMGTMLSARYLLAQGEVQAALHLLEPLLRNAQERKHLRRMLEIQVLLALTYNACGKRSEALQYLHQALAGARSEGFFRLFLDEGPALAILLRALCSPMRSPLLRIYAQNILHAFPVPQDGQGAAHAENDAFPSEQLSPQEQRVLRLLAAGYANQAIARELVVSVNTVHTQVQSIYRKLQVHNRYAASEVARQLNLL